MPTGTDGLSRWLGVSCSTVRVERFPGRVGARPTQRGSPYQIMRSHSQSIEIDFAGSASGDEDGIPSGGRVGVADRFAQPAFHFVSHHGFADPLADHETISIVVEIVRQKANHQQAIDRASPLAMNFGNSLLTAEPVTFLHRTHVAVYGALRVDTRQRLRRPADAGP